MYQLNPAPLDNEKTEKSVLKKTNTKTLKNKKHVNFSDDKTKLTNIADMLSKIQSGDEEDNDNNFKNEMDNFKNAMSNVKNNYDDLLNNNNYDPAYSDMTNNRNMENSVNTSFANFNDSYKSCFDTNIPISGNFTNTQNNLYEENNKLLSKLDYVIHLLEEQHNEKTNHITEELILYLFLGIFIIFVLDSFARASKYVR